MSCQGAMEEPGPAQSYTPNRQRKRAKASFILATWEVNPFVLLESYTGQGH